MIFKINVFIYILNVKLEGIFGGSFTKLLPLKLKHNNKNDHFFLLLFSKLFKVLIPFVLELNVLIVQFFLLCFFTWFFFQLWKVIHLMKITHNHKDIIKTLKKCELFFSLLKFKIMNIFLTISNYSAFQTIKLLP
jgi:hypothetical protein